MNFLQYLNFNFKVKVVRTDYLLNFMFGLAIVLSEKYKTGLFGCDCLIEIPFMTFQEQCRLQLSL